MENDKKTKQTIGLVAIGILVALILVFGETPRHDESVAAGKQKAQEAKNAASPAAAPPAASGPAQQNELDGRTPATMTALGEMSPGQLAEMQRQLASGADKDETDEAMYLTGYGRLRQEATQIGEAEAERPAPGVAESGVGLREPSGLAKDQVNLALARAAKLEEKQPGRYQSSQMTPDGHIYGIDSMTGGVWRLASGAEKWEVVGKPGNAPAGNNGTYFITSTASRMVTIMNQDNAFTWRATLNTATGKWEWKELGGFPQDNSWK